MIMIDTNLPILALVRNSDADDLLHTWLAAGDVVKLGAIVWVEFLCGPVAAADARNAAMLFPHPVPVLAEDPARAAELYNAIGRRRGSLADCLIAASCLRLDASIATLNAGDFSRFEPLEPRCEWMIGRGDR